MGAGVGGGGPAGMCLGTGLPGGGTKEVVVELALGGCERTGFGGGGPRGALLLGPSVARVLPQRSSMRKRLTPRISGEVLQSESQCGVWQTSSPPGPGYPRTCLSEESLAMPCRP